MVADLGILLLRLCLGAWLDGKFVKAVLASALEGAPLNQTRHQARCGTHLFPCPRPQPPTPLSRCQTTTRRDVFAFALRLPIAACLLRLFPCRQETRKGALPRPPRASPLMPFLFPRPFPPPPHTKRYNTCLTLLTNSPHQTRSACAPSASPWWPIPAFRLPRNCRANRRPLEFHGLFFPAASLAREPRPRTSSSRAPRLSGTKHDTKPPASPPTVATRGSLVPLAPAEIDHARHDQEPPRLGQSNHRMSDTDHREDPELLYTKEYCIGLSPPARQRTLRGTETRAKY